MAKNRKVNKKSKKPKRWANTATCRVCGTPHPVEEMKRVTRDSRKLEHWKMTFGQPFVRNISMFKWNFICFSHYLRLQENSQKNDNEEGAEQMENLENDENREEENGSSSIETEEQTETEENSQLDDDIMEMVPWDSKTNIRKLQLKREPIEVQVVPQEQPLRIVRPKREPSPDIEVIEDPNPNVRFAKPNNDQLHCRVCGGSFNRVLMTETPLDPHEMQEWINILGSGFLGNIMNYPPPHFICYSHLKEIVKELCQKK